MLITLVAIVLVGVDLWSFTRPTFLGIPLWLPFFGGIITILVVRITETFVEIEQKR
ncbi:hypothetical protein HZB01_03255 [Candidatus Woesearchaeota archaeon]|nr:hypothetical protein [Candidatus Woesearchaeota archaeon]